MLITDRWSHKFKEWRLLSSACKIIYSGSEEALLHLQAGRVAGSSDTLVLIFQTVHCHTSEDSILHSHHHENLKYHIVQWRHHCPYTGVTRSDSWKHKMAGVVKILYEICYAVVHGLNMQCMIHNNNW
jgi:hypothetical protein